MELTRDAVAQVLEAAGFARHVPPRKRKRDPDPADGFRVVSEAESDGGGVLAVWVTNGGWHAISPPSQRAQARRMAEQYLDALQEAGFKVELAGLGWDYARVLPGEQRPAEGDCPDERGPAATPAPNGELAGDSPYRAALAALNGYAATAAGAAQAVGVLEAQLTSCGFDRDRALMAHVGALREATARLQRHAADAYAALVISHDLGAEYHASGQDAAASAFRGGGT